MASRLAPRARTATPIRIPVPFIFMAWPPGPLPAASRWRSPPSLPHREEASDRAPHSIAPPASASQSPQEARAQAEAGHADGGEKHRLAQRAEKPADERPEEGRAVHADAIDAGGPREPRQ